MTELEPRAVDGQELPRFTVLGLFEDTIDAEQALMALRREERPAEQVSVLVRDRAAESGSGPERHGEVARAVVASTLNAVSGWLLGLAALIVPESGTYLVAGPIGAALAGVRTASDPVQPPTLGDPAVGATLANAIYPIGLRKTLIDFGFRLDEAAYLQNRLAAGSALVAITTADAAGLQSTRRLFADSSAVYIGQAQTGEVIVHEAEERLAASLEDSAADDIVIADAVAPLRHLCGQFSSDAAAPILCGRQVVDSLDESAGDIEDMLADGSLVSSTSPTIRYVVVGFGGVLGLGRHRVAVPAEQVDLRSNPARLSLSKEILRRAPAYELEIPFSRREEMAVNAYFGTTPYWLK